ncbi:MCE family protein [Haloechinothrix halophila]|uniref:MCE family protein n=1 Tax=Haloechinothrix halophila TaxID=1069073 RepID=UPI000402D694|nr:MCE family protein [Haloechinothrix halophila]
MSTTRKRIGLQALGVVFLVVLGLLGWLSVAIYDKAFSDAVPVTLRADRVGTQLAEGADVKARGVVVGSVREIRVVDGGAELSLAIDPDRLAELPAGVSARLLPKSVFGQRFVDLVIPETPGAEPLAAGDVITQDRSAVSIELEQVLNDLLPLLRAVQPQKLAASLGSVAQALDGRGEQLGGTLVDLNDYLAELNPHLPRLQQDLAKFAKLLDTYGIAGPDVVDALADAATTTTTIAERRQDLRALLVTVAGASSELDGFLRPNKENLIALAANSRPILELIAKHSHRFPCLFGTVSDLKPLVDKALGAGTNEPGLHIKLGTKTAPGGRAGATC